MPALLGRTSENRVWENCKRGLMRVGRENTLGTIHTGGQLAWHIDAIYMNLLG